MTLSRAEFQEVLDELQDCGMSLAKLSEAIGLSNGALSNAKSRGVMFGDVLEMARLVRAKAKLLKGYEPTRYSIDYICRESLLKQTYIASHLGISKQALNKTKDKLPQGREQQIANAVHKIGGKFETLASKLEKIKTRD